MLIMSYSLSPWKLQSNLDYPEYERIFQTFLSAHSVFLLLLCWVPTSLSQREKKKVVGVSYAASSGPCVCECERERQRQRERKMSHTESALVSVLKYIDDAFIYLSYLSCPVYKQN